MTNGMTALLIVIGGTALGFYLLMNRGQGRKARRESAGGDTSSTGDSSSDSGWGLFSGSAAIVPRRMIPVLPATPAGTAEAAGEMAAVAAINPENPGNISASARSSSTTPV